MHYKKYRPVLGWPGIEVEIDETYIARKKYGRVLNVEQIDLVPTLATLLQIPIPINNIGVSFYDILAPNSIDALRSILQNAVQLQNLLIGIKSDANLTDLQNCIANAKTVIRSPNLERISEIIAECKNALYDCQDGMISAANYKDHYFVVALLLSFLSVTIFAYKISRTGINRGHLIIFLQAISIFSSSFTEEEQDTCLMVYEMFIAAQAWNEMRKRRRKSTSSENPLQKLLILLVLLFLQRYARSFTEYKRRRWELFLGYKTFNLTKVDEYLETINFDYFQGFVEIGSFIGAAGFLVWVERGRKQLDTLIFWISFVSIALVKWGNLDDNINLYACHFTWLCMVILFFTKKFNLIVVAWLFLVCRRWTYPVLVLMHLTGYLIPIISSNIEITIIYTVMASSFFFVGNANSLSTIDISVGYTGLRSYIPILVGIQILLNAYSGPIMVYMGWLSNMNNADVWKMVKEILFYRFLAMSISMASLFIQRYHLFLWRVFAPKFLFESVHYMIFLLFLCLIYTFTSLMKKVSRYW